MALSLSLSSLDGICARQIVRGILMITTGGAFACAIHRMGPNQGPIVDGTVQSCVKTFLLRFDNHFQNVPPTTPKIYHDTIFQPAIFHYSVHSLSHPSYTSAREQTATGITLQAGEGGKMAGNVTNVNRRDCSHGDGLHYDSFLFLPWWLESGLRDRS